MLPSLTEVLDELDDKLRRHPSFLEKFPPRGWSDDDLARLIEAVKPRYLPDELVELLARPTIAPLYQYDVDLVIEEYETPLDSTSHFLLNVLGEEHPGRKPQMAEYVMFGEAQNGAMCAVPAWVEPLERGPVVEFDTRSLSMGAPFPSLRTLYLAAMVAIDLTPRLRPDLDLMGWPWQWQDASNFTRPEAFDGTSGFDREAVAAAYAELTEQINNIIAREEPSIFWPDGQKTVSHRDSLAGWSDRLEIATHLLGRKFSSSGEST